LISQGAFVKLSASDEVKTTDRRVIKMCQMYFKNRESARAVKSGKIQDNGSGAMKRWGRLVEAKPTAKETSSLTCTKDHRYPEKANIVQVLKIKKNKLK
jgi:hypothetical protein